MLKSDELKAEKKLLLDRNDELLKVVEKRDLSADEDKEFNDNATAIEDLNGKIATAEKKEWQELQKTETRSMRNPVSVPSIRTSRKSDPVYSEAELLKNFTLGLSDIRGDKLKLSQLIEEHRDLNTGTPGDGGYTLKSGFIPTLIEKLQLFSKFRQFATVMPTPNGEDLHWPSVDNTAGRVSSYTETQEVEDTATDQDPVFGEKIFKRYRRSTDVLKVSVDLLANTSISNFPGLLAGFLSEMRGRSESDELGGNNAGTTAPEGFFHGISAGKTLTSDELSWTDLVDLESSVDPEYLDQPGIGYVMHPHTYGTIRKFASAEDNVPIYIPSLSAGGPGRTINGWPVYFCSSMAKTTDLDLDSDVLIAFGKLNDYVIRDITSQDAFITYQEIYRKNGQIGLQLEYWYDARWTRTDSVKTLVSAAYA